MQILVINLPESTDRLEFQQQQMKRLGLDFEIIRAVSTSHVHERAHYHLALGWERPLRKTEIACYLSHHKAWQAVLKRNKPALILEDDAMLSRHVPVLLRELEQHSDCDLVTLEVRGRKKIVAKQRQELLGDYHLVPLYQDRTGAAGYILWPSGAKILLAKAKSQSPSLADAFISSTYELRSFQLEPAAIIQLDQCETYGVINRFETQSSISSEEKPEMDYIPLRGKINFRKRRLLSQLRMGWRQVSVMNHSVKRPIELHTDDFL